MEKQRYAESGENSFYGQYLYNQIVPANHFLRMLNEIIDWKRYTHKLIRLYKGEGVVGRPPFDPALVLKADLIAFLYNLSERQVEVYINENLPAKYFVGLAVDQKAPDYSTLTVFRERLLRCGKLKVFEEMLAEIIQIAQEKGVQFGSIQIVDSVHSVANVNTAKDAQRQTKGKAPHDPDTFGVRASWAAGVRSRLPAEHRQTLDLAIKQISPPLFFVHSLPAPKNAAVVIDALKKMPASRVLETLSFPFQTSTDFKETLLNTRPGHKWTPAERQVLLENDRSPEQHTQSAYLEGLYQIWSDREAFGGKLVKALEAYVDSFFAEEEQRILPVLKQGLSHAQMRAGSQPLPVLLEELSNGVRLEKIDSYSRIVLAPSFWGSPYMFLEKLSPDTLMIVFGARPDSMAVIPGDIVPDALIRSLKALSDSTRLRILRYLAQSPRTATELSRALRLRPPTVLHHLNQLRMAGVVQILLSEEGERQFSPRYDGFENTVELLKHFVQGE